MPPDEAKTVTRHESFAVLRRDWKLIATIEEGLCKAVRRRVANDVATPSSAMSTSALIRLHAAKHTDVGVLLRRLNSRLNRSPEPPVLVTEVDGLICFRAQTWQPILRARVEDALEELIGSTWSCGFRWT